MHFAPPLRLKDQYFVPIEAEIVRLFADVIYRPLLFAIKNPNAEFMNAGSALFDAIVNGTVYWQDGHFKGNFNSQITKELRAIGAMYNPASRSWSLTRELIPTDLRFAQAGADQRYDNLRHAFLRTLNNANIDSIDSLSRTKEEYGKAINWMEDDFQKSLRAITIEVKLTDAQRGIISQQWGQNLDLYIKDWASQNILALRESVQANAFAGRRSVDMIEMLKANYGVSQRKAKFLARQETSLLLSKFRETRYRDVGSNRYKWSTSHDQRVRHDHEELHNNIYSWDLPPITNRHTGKRNNPGEDFGCRCVAIPVFD